VALVWVSWDLSRPLGSLDEIYKRSSIVGWLTSTGQDGEVLAIPKGRLGELISGPGLGAKTKAMSFNSTQSRTVIGLLTGHNTLRRHLYLLGLQDSPLCRKCGVMEETSAHIHCECDALSSLRHAYLGSFFLGA